MSVELYTITGPDAVMISYAATDPTITAECSGVALGIEPTLAEKRAPYTSRITCATELGMHQCVTQPASQQRLHYAGTHPAQKCVVRSNRSHIWRAHAPLLHGHPSELTVVFCDADCDTGPMRRHRLAGEAKRSRMAADTLDLSPPMYQISKRASPRTL